MDASRREQERDGEDGLRGGQAQPPEQAGRVDRGGVQLYHPSPEKRAELLRGNEAALVIAQRRPTGDSQRLGGALCANEGRMRLVEQQERLGNKKWLKRDEKKREADARAAKAKAAEALQLERLVDFQRRAERDKKLAAEVTAASRRHWQQQDPAAQAADQQIQRAVKEHLHAVPSADRADALATMRKVLGNVLAHPAEMKYRRLRAKNPAFAKSLGRHESCVLMLRLAGFLREEKGELDYVLPPAELQRVRDVDLALEEFDSSLSPKPSGCASRLRMAVEQARLDTGREDAAQPDQPDRRTLAMVLKEARLEQLGSVLAENGYDLAALEQLDRADWGTMVATCGLKPGHAVRLRTACGVCHGSAADEKKRADALCGVCLDGQTAVAAACRPCGHTFCTEHAALTVTLGKCHTCRQPVSDTQKIYF